MRRKFIKKVINFELFELYDYNDELAEWIFGIAPRKKPKIIITPYVPYTIDFFSIELRMNKDFIQDTLQMYDEKIDANLMAIVSFANLSLLHNFKAREQIIMILENLNVDFIGIMLMNHSKLDLSFYTLRSLRNFIKRLKRKTNAKIISIYGHPLDKLLGFDGIVLSPEEGYGKILEAQGGYRLARIYVDTFKREIDLHALDELKPIVEKYGIDLGIPRWLKGIQLEKK